MTNSRYISREWLEQHIHTGMAITEAMQTILDAPGPWIDPTEELPPDGEIVIALCSGKISEHHRMEDASMFAEYDRREKMWILDDYPEAVDVTVSAWMYQED